MISNVGKIIKAKRKSKGYSIEELSHRSGVSAKTIQRLENDLTNPRGFTLQKIADALDIDIEILTNSFKQLNSIDQLNETGIDELKKNEFVSFGYDCYSLDKSFFSNTLLH